MEKNKCSYTNKEGLNINNCNDLPVTYCEKCRTFYIVLEDGSREEIMSNPEKEVFG